MDRQILIKCSDEDRKYIEIASKNLGLGHSTFCRMASLEKARSVLKDSIVRVENTS